MKRLCTLLAAALAFILPAQATEITYWLWDSRQQPGYEAAARKFEKDNPGITIKITQLGWNDYWTALSTAFVSGTAPDVFTNHLARYPEQVQNELLVDIQPFIEKEKVPTDIYLGELYKLWGREGKQYGLPKDWDTIGIVYNKDLAQKAGLDPASLAEMDWNPKDGGNFGKFLAQISVDEAGKNGLDPAFNSKKVAVYGMAFDVLSPFGQTGWSNLAVANGFKFHDAPWSTKFYYDDPKLAETMQWLADQSLKKGFLVPARNLKQDGAVLALFAAGKTASGTIGSWSVSWCIDNCKFPVGFLPLPKGPQGRKSMFNGLADSIWTGSKHQEEAWKWVKYLGSPEAQKIVGEQGVVFPAVKEAAEIAEKVMSKRGADVSPFLKEAVDPNGTFLFPVADRAAETVTIFNTAVDEIFISGAPAADSLKKANEEINALFE
ncbi:MAG TPA: sugar ABC transporter substrate-binding protein [Chthoniobacterales bacterium]